MLFYMTTSDLIPNKSTLRILHTSDWHLGKRLYQEQRYDEFAQFLDWLIDVLNEHEVDVLIVAGDIFDTMTPSNKAQELYYKFLGSTAKSACRHVIITAGNHDSPTFLDAPKTILRALNVQVIGIASDDISDELLILHKGDTPEAIILAVPYLRDRDVRASKSFDDITTKEHDTIQGITNHYQTLSEQAKQTQADILNKFNKKIPIIATGHLFAAGASVSSKDDGMRDLYVGTLGQISANTFDKCIDYVALGHIHAPQKVAGRDHIRYCGSPIAMGFGEAGKAKQVLLVDFDDANTKPSITALPVPVFQKLARINGDWDQITKELSKLIQDDQSIWVEIIYTGNEIRSTLVQDIRSLLEDSLVIALNIQNKTLYQQSLSAHHQTIDLKQLTEMQVFETLLNQNDIEDAEQQVLKQAYQTLLTDLHDTDHRAE